MGGDFVRRGVNHRSLFDERRTEAASASIPSFIHMATVRVAAGISDRAGIGPLADAERFT
jgi:hypothetical protein